jgi:hypothetical protein
MNLTLKEQGTKLKYWKLAFLLPLSIQQPIMESEDSIVVEDSDEEDEIRV